MYTLLHSGHSYSRYFFLCPTHPPDRRVISQSQCSMVLHCRIWNMEVVHQRMYLSNKWIVIWCEAKGDVVREFHVLKKTTRNYRIRFDLYRALLSQQNLEITGFSWTKHKRSLWNMHMVASVHWVQICVYLCDHICVHMCVCMRVYMNRVCVCMHACVCVWIGCACVHVCLLLPGNVFLNTTRNEGTWFLVVSFPYFW